MNWHNEFFTTLVLVGFIFSLVGSLFYKNPPQDINSLVGYRTTRSMKNQAHWDFSQVYSSKMMMYCGLGLMLLSLLGLFITFEEKTTDILIFASIIGAAILMIFLTERAMKKRFR